MTYFIFPFLLLLVGFFLVRKYTIITGVTFLLLGISYTASWQLFLINDQLIGLLFPFIGCPLVVSTTLDGILFLASGLIRRRQETIPVVQIEEPTSISPEPVKKLPRINIGVIAIVVASLSVLDFILLGLTIVFGGNLSQSEFIYSYGAFYLLFWGLWPIISIVGFIIGLVGIFLHNKKAIIGFLIEVFQMVILGVFWFLSIFAFL